MGENPDKKIYGLLGKNISYSLSPVMHNAAFRHFKIPATYQLFDIPEDGLKTFFEDHVLNGELSGFNVTVPYKTRVCELMSSFEGYSYDPTVGAKMLGALNTVKVDGKKLYGENTDVLGFLYSLAIETKFPLKGKSVFISGAGGVGRAIGIFLAAVHGTKIVSVYDTSETQIASLLEFISGTDYAGDMFLINDKTDALRKLSESDLVINATPLGTNEGDPLPFDPDLLKSDAVVYDVVYARETELIKKAKEKGITTVNGLGMLVYQGAYAFHIWTGEDVEKTAKIMIAAIQEELKKRG